MAVTVGYIQNALEKLMPSERAEGYDNVGLLAGSRARTVTRVLCALDVNERVVDEATKLGAELIVSHHPILFRGRKNLCEDDPEGKMLARLVRERLSLIAVHTNYDSADNGVNDALAQALGLREVSPLEGGMRIGAVDSMPLAQFSKQVELALGGVVRRYGDPDREISRVAVLGGSGGGYARIALEAGADVYVTGEIGYHIALDSNDLGTCVLEAGHAATEKPTVRHLAGILKSIPGADIEVIESTIELFL